MSGCRRTIAYAREDKRGWNPVHLMGICLGYRDGSSSFSITDTTGKVCKFKVCLPWHFRGGGRRVTLSRGRFCVAQAKSEAAAREYRGLCAPPTSSPAAAARAPSLLASRGVARRRASDPAAGGVKPAVARQGGQAPDHCRAERQPGRSSGARRNHKCRSPTPSLVQAVKAVPTDPCRWSGLPGCPHTGGLSRYGA